MMKSVERLLKSFLFQHERMKAEQARQNEESARKNEVASLNATIANRETEIANLKEQVNDSVKANDVSKNCMKSLQVQYISFSRNYILIIIVYKT